MCLRSSAQENNKKHFCFPIQLSSRGFPFTNLHFSRNISASLLEENDKKPVSKGMAGTKVPQNFNDAGLQLFKG